jgi:5-methyltetrahydrofolate--homocysteine methyltransferase
MQGMERVGELFGNGPLFLPQVIRSAEIMSRVVEMLQPYMPTNHQGTEKAKVILATVKGDVHDIGKNICATLLRCNGFEVIDLGVMVHSEKIVEATIQHQPLFIGLSGLITPSLVEMQTVMEACKAARLKVPVLIGGATTSAEHTACCLAPCYDYPVLWTPDDSQLVNVGRKLYAQDSKQMFSTYVEELQNQQIKCREERHEELSLRSLSEARKSQVSLY